MVGLVVDDQNVFGRGHLAQHFAHVCLVAECASLIDASPLADLLFAGPIQHVPVAH